MSQGDHTCERELAYSPPLPFRRNLFVEELPRKT